MVPLCVCHNIDMHAFRVCNQFGNSYHIASIMSLVWHLLGPKVPFTRSTSYWFLGEKSLLYLGSSWLKVCPFICWSLLKGVFKRTSKTIWMVPSLPRAGSDVCLLVSLPVQTDLTIDLGTKNDGILSLNQVTKADSGTYRCQILDFDAPPEVILEKELTINVNCECLWNSTRGLRG